MQEAEPMARRICPCTLRDPDAVDFDPRTGELTIRDATAVPAEEIAGTDLVFRFKASAAYKLAVSMLEYHRRILEQEIEDLAKEAEDGDELIAELRDHIQRLECPYETRQEADQ